MYLLLQRQAMRLFSLLLASLWISTLSARAETYVIQSFEGDGFGDWQVGGRAFGLAPVHGKVDGLEGELQGFAGKALLCSATSGNLATGAITSPEIPIVEPYFYLGFLIGGGSQPDKLAVQLLVDGKVVRSATGNNSFVLRQEVWNLSEYKGKKVVIRVLDDATGSWGFIAADQFVFSTNDKPDFAVLGNDEMADHLVRVPSEASVAVFPGLNFKQVADYKSAQITSPTSIAFGNQGQLFIAETHRFRFGVEDDRDCLYWYLQDLSNRTNEERKAMYEKWSSKKSSDYFTAKSEVIRLLSEEKSDGTYAKSSVFADNFRDALDGTAGGVFAWDDTVYFACIPKLWMLRNPAQSGVSNERKVIEDGFGVRVSFSGHDMNGFVLGYDGRLYGTIGDRGFNLTTKEGRKYDHPDIGAVFRFEPDGTQFEVIYKGLRNPKEFAFDQFGNAVTIDNNSDQGDKARLVYVVEGGDSGWEMEHQAMHTFHREIGLERRPPSRWMNERMWETQNPSQPAFMLPPVDYICAGPSGLTYNPGAGFLESEVGHFHICDYRGSSSASGIWSFKIEPLGGGMRMADKHQLIWGLAATDIEYDWKGRLFISDFIGGWESHEAGRIVSLTAEKPHQPEASAQVASFIREGLNKKTSAELAVLLSHPDQRIRLRAQLELTRRPEGLAVFEKATQSKNLIERLHSIWGLGILSRRGPAIAPNDVWNNTSPAIASVEDRTKAAKILIPLLADADVEVRAQTVRALSESPLLGNDLPLGKLILDPSLRVRSFAAIAAGRMGADKFLPEVFKMLQENADVDPVLRHAGSMAIDGMCKTAEQLDAAIKHESASVRLAAVITLRRRADASVERLVQDPSTLVADEAIRAINDKDLKSARPAVAALIDSRSKREWSPFMLRRLIHNAYRVGGEENAARVVAVAVDESAPEEVRLEALRLMSLWVEPFPVNQFTGHWSPLPKRATSEVHKVLSAALPQLIKGNSELIRATLDLVGKYQLNTDSLPNQTLANLVANQYLTGTARSKALEMLLARQSDDVLEIAKKYASDVQDDVALIAIAELARQKPELGLLEYRKAVTAPSAYRRQQAWKALATFQAGGVEALFLEQIKAIETSKGVSSAAIELMEAAQARSEASIKTALEALKTSLNSNPDTLMKWMPSLEGGDASHGFALFQALPAGQCMRCHKYSADGHSAGGEAGPNLAGVAKRGDRRYLLESIVHANAAVASGYGAVNIELVNGGALTGTLLQDTPNFVDVDVAGNRWRVARSDIKSMTPPVSGMPVLENALTPYEVRDLVAWLSTLDKGVQKEKLPDPKPLDISTIKPVAPVTVASNIDPAMMTAGKNAYMTCAGCHGANGEGTAIAPPLANSNWVNGPIDNLIRIQLRGLQGPITVSGKKYTPPMPMMPLAHQTDDQIAAVLTYIRNSFGNSASAVKPEEVKALRGEVGKPMLTEADLIPTK